MDSDVNSGNPVDLYQAPRPRKRMRKGTKSCTKCRRRKTRCTADPIRPQTCRECGLRGTNCIEQDQDDCREGQQPYSLRERVMQLEAVVQMLSRRLDAVDGGSDDPSARSSQPRTHAKD
ncbi:hypothetical protein BJX66DRAFT_115206 [Aspergillus keveii]|uniref:Zn(2)-C6 fungal-type domain-containing protein n=1 Tax=Aspergillus keveii TaxID=714993 RepID=A0ABR4FKM3_9EURO